MRKPGAAVPEGMKEVVQDDARDFDDDILE